MIAIEKLAKRYGKLVAVEDLSLTVHAGETVALFGPNGSGKTTVLKAVAGLIRPSSGNVYLNGQPVEPRRGDLRAFVAYLPQRVSFDEHMTVGEILRLYASLRGISLERMRAQAERFGVAGLEDRPAGKLSGGQRQRLGLAIALAGEARIWLLDEPTAGLDPIGTQTLRAIIREHRQTGGTVLFSTHLLADAEALADRVAIMREGHIASLCACEELREALLGLSTLVVTVANPDQRYCEAISSCGATIVHMENGTMEVAAPSRERLAVLKALEAAGAQLVRFNVKPPSAERLIAALTEGDDARNA